MHEEPGGKNHRVAGSAREWPHHGTWRENTAAATGVNGTAEMTGFDQLRCVVKS
jgi:hypothetical protein